MKVLKEEMILKCSAKKLWSILSDVSRCDWVPSVKKLGLRVIAEYLKWKEWEKL
jgi:hypothetical protein